MGHVNPLFGIFRTLFLYLRQRIIFDPDAVGNRIETADGTAFTIFRRVEIRNAGTGDTSPKGLFIVRFTPTAETAKNIRLSRLLMSVFMGFTGFRSKYWCVNETSGECLGIYEWDTMADVKRYAASIAVRNMTRRSEPGSVSYLVLENIDENRQWHVIKTSSAERARFKRKFRLR